MISFEEHYKQYIILEDLQSVLNQCKNILINNNVQNPDYVLQQFQHIFDDSKIQRPASKDGDILGMVLMHLGGVSVDLIKHEYNRYSNIPELYNKNYLINWANELIQLVKSKKLFKPSQEKTDLFQEWSGKLVIEIHKYNIPTAKEDDGVEEPLDNSTPSANRVYDDRNISIFLADTMKKCIYYGQNTGLCISYPPASNYFWKYRMGISPYDIDGGGMSTYFVIWKNGDGSLNQEKKIIVDSIGDEDGGWDRYTWNPISPNSDNEITKDNLIRKFPELTVPFTNGVFAFIPYGGYEKRAMEIQDYKSILDPRLKTVNDYDIFVQLDVYIRDPDWDKLQLPLTVVTTLYRKYCLGGNVASLERMIKYKLQNDIAYYEEVFWRSADKQEKAFFYILNKNHLNLISPEHSLKVKQAYDKAQQPVIDLEKHIRADAVDGVYPDNIFVPTSTLTLPDLTDIKCQGDFICNSSTSLQSLEGAPTHVGGEFSCGDCPSLQSLEGAPTHVGKNFNCGSCTSLQSLEGAPTHVGRNFNCGSCTSLQSLEGAPTHVGGEFYCGSCTSLQSLEGAPTHVGGNFNCGRCISLQSLEGAPTHVGGGFYCGDCPSLQSLEGAPTHVGRNFNCGVCTSLQSLEGAPTHVGGEFYCAYCTSLQSLEGAPTHVGGEFYCGSCTSLQSLEGAPLENYRPMDMAVWATDFKEKLRHFIYTQSIKEKDSRTLPIYGESYIKHFNVLVEMVDRYNR